MRFRFELRSIRSRVICRRSILLLSTCSTSVSREKDRVIPELKIPVSERMQFKFEFAFVVFLLMFPVVETLMRSTGSRFPPTKREKNFAAGLNSSERANLIVDLKAFRRHSASNKDTAFHFEDALMPNTRNPDETTYYIKCLLLGEMSVASEHYSSTKICVSAELKERTNLTTRLISAMFTDHAVGDLATIQFNLVSERVGQSLEYKTTQTGEEETFKMHYCQIGITRIFARTKIDFKRSSYLQ